MSTTSYESGLAFRVSQVEDRGQEGQVFALLHQVIIGHKATPGKDWHLGKGGFLTVEGFKLTIFLAGSYSFSLEEKF